VRLRKDGKRKKIDPGTFPSSLLNQVKKKGKKKKRKRCDRLPFLVYHSEKGRGKVRHGRSIISHIFPRGKSEKGGGGDSSVSSLDGEGKIHGLLFCCKGRGRCSHLILCAQEEEGPPACSYAGKEERGRPSYLIPLHPRREGMGTPDPTILLLFFFASVQRKEKKKNDTHRLLRWRPMSCRKDDRMYPTSLLSAMTGGGRRGEGRTAGERCCVSGRGEAPEKKKGGVHDATCLRTSTRRRGREGDTEGVTTFL